MSRATETGEALDLTASTIARNVVGLEKLLVLGQVLFLVRVLRRGPLPRRAVVHEVITGSDELLGRQSPGLAELGLDLQRRQVFGDPQVQRLNRVDDVLHRHRGNV